MYLARAASLLLRRLRLRRSLPLALGLLFLSLAAFNGGPAAAQSVVIEMRQGAFDDDRVRKAIILSTNWPLLAERGGGVRADAILLREGRRENEIPARRPAPGDARRLLAEAGYAQKPLQHFIFYEAPLEKMALALAGVLKDIGLASQPQLITPQTRERMIAATRFATGRQTVELPYLLLTLEKIATAPPPPQLADLVVIGRPAADFAAESRFLTLSVGVANRGAAAAGPHQLRFIDRSGTLEFPPVEISSLGPRESRSFKTGLEVPESLLGRELLIFAVVDAERRVLESDEANNRGDALTVLLPRPPQRVDLVVQGAPKARYDRESGELRVAVAVANLGGAAAGPHRLVLIDHSGTIEFPPFEVPELGGRESVGFETRLPLPPSVLGRELLLQAEADPDDRVRESDEENNRGETLAFLLPPPPRAVDLVVTGAPAVAYDEAHRALTVEVTVANLGNVEAGANRLTLIDRSGTLRFQALPVNPLPPGGKRNLTARLQVPEAALGRTLLLLAEVDAGGTVREVDEGNNLSEARRFALPAAPPPLRQPRPERLPETPPEVVPPPEIVEETPEVVPEPVAERPPEEATPPQEAAQETDLAITALHIRRQETSTGAEVSLTIANRGAAPSPATEVELRAESAGALERIAVPALPVGGVWQAVWTVPLAETIFSRDIGVAAFVDPDNTVPEAVESNNQQRQSLVLPTPPSTWIVGIAVAAAVLLLTVWMLRGRAPRETENAEAPALRLSYRPRADPGAQSLLRREEGPAVVFKLALQPRPDRGSQRVTLLSGQRQAER